MKLKKGDKVLAWHIKSVFGINFECVQGTVIKLYQGNNETCIKILGDKVIGINFVKSVKGTEFNLSLKVFKISKDFEHIKRIRKACLLVYNLCQKTTT
jgi:hypothetical protein